MAQITLKIIGDAKNANEAISTIKKNLDALDHYKINVSVDASGIEALSKNIQSVEQGAQQIGSNLDKIKLNNLKISGDELRNSTKALHEIMEDTAGNKRETDKWNLSLGKTLTIIEETGEESSKTATIIRENYDQIRKAQEKAAANEKKYDAEAMEYLRKEEEAEKKAAEAAAAVPTKLQEKINAITGVDKAYKSAAKSAEIFEKAAAESRMTSEEEAQSIRDAAAAYEKYTAEKAAAAKPTRLQSQIDALTGVSAVPSSAASSAEVFRMSGLTDIEQQLTNAGYALRTYENSINELLPVEARAETQAQMVAEALAGMGREYKSAAESASVFANSGLTKTEIELNKNSKAAIEATQAYEQYKESQAAAVTPLQEQINAITGVSRSFKSAKDSAEIFRMNGLTPLEKQLRNAEKAMSDVAGKTESLISNIAKFTRWYLIGNAVHAITASLRDALDTMKAVDSELVTVRKVTGITGDALDALKDHAYEMASAYGVAVDAFLETESAFARAGYRDQIEALAELSTKTQIVGDMTAEVANQFLLSVDAAYKYDGAIDKLSHTIDAANELDNRYATSMTKIADGMGIVAPVAAQLGVSVDQLMAMLGTVTAVTQRSGSEAARALRSILINLTSDINATFTEMNGDVTYAIGEIDGLRDVVKLYAQDLYDAAQATGKILNPTEVIEALVRAADEGRLSEQKLYDLVTDESGKMRAAQLWALIQNWNTTYKSMLADVSFSMGSADKEVENALDSWERKTEQLKNTWTKFVSSLVSTEAIKGVIDILIVGVNVLDSGIGKFALFTASGAAAAKTVTALVDAFKKAKIVTTFADIMTGAAFATGGFTAKVAALTAALNASPLLLGAAVAAGIYGIVKIIDALTVSTEEHTQAVRDASQAYKEVQAELDSLKAKLEENNRLIAEGQKAGASEIYIRRLQTENAYLEQQIKLQNAAAAAARKKLADEARSALTDKSYFTTHKSETNKGETREIIGFVNVYDYADSLLEAAKVSKEYDEKLQDAVQTTLDHAGALADAAEGAENLVGKDKELYDRAMELSEAYTQFTKDILGVAGAEEDAAEAAKKAADATGELADAQETAYENADDLAAQCKAVAAALSDYANYGNLTTDSINDLKEAIPGLVDILYDEEGKLTDVGIAALETAGTLDTNRWAVEYLQATVNSLSVSNAINQINSVRDAALTSATAAIALNNALKTLGVSDPRAGAAMVARKEVASLDDFLAQAAGSASALPESIAAAHTKKTTSSSSSSHSSGSGSAADKTLEALNQEVADAKALYALMEKQGKSASELEGQAKKVQAALHKQAEHMRATKAASAEIDSISADWWVWQEKIAKAYEDEAKAAEELKRQKLAAYQDEVSLLEAQASLLEAQGAGQDEIIAKKREIVSAMKAQLDYMKSVNAEEKDLLALTEKIVKAEEQIAKTLRDSAADALAALGESLEEYEDQMTGPLQEQLDALKAQHEAVKDAREEEEKRLAVEKARLALENAQKQRTVRQYNAESGQWEWVANGKAVESAKNDLEAAETALKDYLDEQAYKAQTDALDGKIKSIGKAFDALKKAWDEAVQAVRDGKMSYEEAYAYIKDAMKGIYEQYGVDLSGVLNKANALLNKTLNTIYGLTESQKKRIQSAIDSVISSLEIPEDLREKFIDAVQKILEAPELSPQVKTKFIEDISKILTAPDLSENIKTAFIDDVTRILTSPVLDESVKVDFIDAVTAILTAPELGEKTKEKLLTDITDIFADERLAADIKSSVKDALTTLVQKGGKQAENDLKLFTAAMKNALATQNPEGAIKELSDAIRNGVIENLDSVSTILKALNGDYEGISEETAKLLAVTKMQSNSAMWWTLRSQRDAALSSGDDRAAEKYQAQMDALHRENEEIGNTIGLSYESTTGQWYDQNREPAYSVSREEEDEPWEQWDPWEESYTPPEQTNPQQSGSGGKTYTGGTIVSNVGSNGLTHKSSSENAKNFILYAAPGDSMVGSDGSYWTKNGDGTTTVVLNGNTYQYDKYVVNDQGGLLHGMGRISEGHYKATEEDELVLPPDLTRAVLTPALDGETAKALDQMRVLYGTKSAASVSFGGATTDNGTHIGVQYVVDGVTLSEQQADAMTVSQFFGFVQQHRNLPLYSGVAR